MNIEQIKYIMTLDYYRAHEQIGNTITPVYKVRVCKQGLLVWFGDYNKLMEWLSL
jgi:hypothetical protein